MQGKRIINFVESPYIVPCPECGAFKYSRCKEDGTTFGLFTPHPSRLIAAHNHKLNGVRKPLPLIFRRQGRPLDIQLTEVARAQTD